MHGHSYATISATISKLARNTVRRHTLKSTATVLMAGICLGVSACATTPVPEEVCSAEWISARTDKAMAEFGRDVRPMMRTFRRAGRVAEGGNVLGAFQSLQLVNAVTKMLGKIQDSQALKDVQTLGATCNDPDLLGESFTNFMRDQGASDQVIDMIDTVRGLIPSDGKV